MSIQALKVRRFLGKIALVLGIFLALFVIANSLLFKRQISQVKQSAQHGFGYMWKFHSNLPLTAHDIEKSVEILSKNPGTKITIYECDHNGDGNVDDPKTMALANNFDQKRFLGEFSLCGNPNDVSQSPYFWVYAQQPWLPLGGNVIGIQPFNITALERFEFDVYEIAILVDDTTIATISSCGKEAFPACSPKQIILKRLLSHRHLFLPYDHLTFLIINSNEKSWQASEPCAMMPLDNHELKGCHYFEFTKINAALDKTGEIFVANHSARAILVLLTEALEIADAKKFTQANPKTWANIFIIGIDNEKIYNNFVNVKKNDWLEFKLSELKLKYKEKFEPLLSALVDSWLNKLVPTE